MMSERTHEKAGAPAKPGPVRTCAGCAKRVPGDELVRVVLDRVSGAVAVDLADSQFGRGAHVHPTAECLTKAVRAGFAKSFKAKVETSVESICSQIASGADRRIEGLLSGARRARHAVAGADIVAQSLREGDVPLVVVATDALAAVKVPEIERAIASGRAIAWNQKQGLGALFGRDEVAVVAVTNDGVASAIQAAYRVSRPFVGSRSEAWWSPEVR